MSARFALRDLTRAAHDRVDAKLSAFDLSDRDQYAAFLMVQAAAFLPVEAALDAAGAAVLLHDWPARRRGDALIADLEALDRSIPDPVAAPSFADAPAIWGGIYVLEGSRLGGAMLRKTVPAGLPRSFLSRTAGKSAWPSLVAALERNLHNDVIAAQAGRSAIETFACFERAYESVELNELE